MVLVAKQFTRSTRSTKTECINLRFRRPPNKRFPYFLVPGPSTSLDRSLPVTVRESSWVLSGDSSLQVFEPPLYQSTLDPTAEEVVDEVDDLAPGGPEYSLGVLPVELDVAPVPQSPGPGSMLVRDVGPRSQPPRVGRTMVSVRSFDVSTRGMV